MRAPVSHPHHPSVLLCATLDQAPVGELGLGLQLALLRSHAILAASKGSRKH